MVEEIMMSKLCEQCGLIFFRKKRGGIKQFSERRFCSKKCDINSKSPPLITKICEGCGVNFIKKPKITAPEWGVRRFCSSKCANRNRPTISIQDRFWEKVKKIKNGCWEWCGGKDGHGYGSINTKRGMSPSKSHRLSWEIHFGKIPNGLNVCHACDNPGCVNPHHLMLGTQKANMVDASRKERINIISLGNLCPGATGFKGAGPKSNKEIANVQLSNNRR